MDMLLIEEEDGVEEEEEVPRECMSCVAIGRDVLLT